MLSEDAGRTWRFRCVEPVVRKPDALAAAIGVDCSMGDEFVKDLTSALLFRLGVERLLPALWALSDLALVLPSVHPVASSAHPS